MVKTNPLSVRLDRRTKKFMPILLLYLKLQNVGLLYLLGKHWVCVYMEKSMALQYLWFQASFDAGKEGHVVTGAPDKVVVSTQCRVDIEMRVIMGGAIW